MIKQNTFAEAKGQSGKKKITLIFFYFLNKKRFKMCQKNLVLYM